MATLKFINLVGKIDQDDSDFLSELSKRFDICRQIQNKLVFQTWKVINIITMQVMLIEFRSILNSLEYLVFAYHKVETIEKKYDVIFE
jgi:hypothetical protein